MAVDKSELAFKALEMRVARLERLLANLEKPIEELLRWQMLEIDSKRKKYERPDVFESTSLVRNTPRDLKTLPLRQNHEYKQSQKDRADALRRAAREWGAWQASISTLQESNLTGYRAMEDLGIGRGIGRRDK